MNAFVACAGRPHARGCVGAERCNAAGIDGGTTRGYSPYLIGEQHSLYAPGTCARASHIALEEAGASYTAERLDFKNSQQTTPQYLAINPKGRVPALVTDRGTLTETPAILAFIAQSFPQARLVPDDLPSRSRRRSPSTTISARRCTSIMRTRCAAIAGRSRNPRLPT